MMPGLWSYQARHHCEVGSFLGPSTTNVPIFTGCSRLATGLADEVFTLTAASSITCGVVVSTVCADNTNTNAVACGEEKNTHDASMKLIKKIPGFVATALLQIVSCGLFGLQMFWVFRFFAALKRV
jgi:hypothetical protein